MPRGRPPKAEADRLTGPAYQRVSVTLPRTVYLRIAQATREKRNVPNWIRALCARTVADMPELGADMLESSSSSEEEEDDGA